jgi:hypothetical protein
VECDRRAEVGAGNGPSIDMAISSPATPVTVALTVPDQTGPIVFGSQTFTPLTRVDALRSTIVNSLREMNDGRWAVGLTGADHVSAPRSCKE